MAVPEDMHLAHVASGRGNEPQPVHEGDTCVFLGLAKTAWNMATAEAFRREAFAVKVNDAYTAYAITLEQWAALYNIINGKDPDAPLTDAPPIRDHGSLNLTQQTILNRQHGIK